MVDAGAVYSSRIRFYVILIWRLGKDGSSPGRSAESGFLGLASDYLQKSSQGTVDDIIQTNGALLLNLSTHPPLHKKLHVFPR
ncbi:hypothetical protein JZ751_003089 [Albula glossodonta]|uniref:Uncharacterized protein n=1 Tax=Albula glossodonta TaxID=121402 RepID=A0A8T2ND29_9TELE|nr:hypothetical protein JZ751_003089 [Albula glossodonta]